MSFSSLMARALAGLALCAGAAAATPWTAPESAPGSAPESAMSAADPRAAVPPTTYRPALRYRTAPPPTGTPDGNWRASNAAVTRKPMMTMAMPAADPHAAHRQAPACAAPCENKVPSPPMQPMHGAAHQHGETR